MNAGYITPRQLCRHYAKLFRKCSVWICVGIILNMYVFGARIMCAKTVKTNVNLYQKVSIYVLSSLIYLLVDVFLFFICHLLQHFHVRKQETVFL